MRFAWIRAVSSNLFRADWGEGKTDPAIVASADGAGRFAGCAELVRMPVVTCALTAAFAALAINHALAIDIRQVNEPDSKAITIMLTGQVVSGDSLKVRSFIGKVGDSRPITAQLGFAGGFRPDAMSIGRFFHQARIRTVIPAKARCISPCSLALLGGRDSGTGRSLYIKYSSAFLGFSGVNPSYPEKDYTVGDLDLAVASTQRDILQVADYLRDVGADINMLRYYQSVLKPNEIRYITNEQALDLGISVIIEETGELIAPLRRLP